MAGFGAVAEKRAQNYLMKSMGAKFKCAVFSAHRTVVANKLVRGSRNDLAFRSATVR
jgi:hypothetical protein